MNIRRGVWTQATNTKSSSTSTRRYGPRPAALISEGQSNSSAYLEKRGIAPSASAHAESVVSDVRNDTLVRATEMKESGIPGPLIVYSNSYKRTQEIKNAYGLPKTAATSTVGGVSFGSSGTDVSRQAPEVYSPLFQIANLQLPRDRITMNAWNRNFYDTHPLVHNCINLHATYPINKISIKCKDQKVEQFFNDMIEEMDLIGILQNIALEFWKCGECFPYAELDETRGVWKNIVIQNPDYIHVKKAVLAGEPIISLRPDAALQRLVQSNNPADIQLKQQIDEEILYHVRKGENIPLDNFHVSHLKMVSSPYDTHGTSVIVSIYKDLMLYDKLRESKFAQADNLVNPITLISVGGNNDGEYRATEEDLQKWRNTFEAAQYDKDFKIISHAGVKIERIGASGQIIDIAADMNFILDNIMYGLMVPKAVLTQEGASFNSATIGLEVLKQRYESFRNMMAQWLTKKIFAPISEIHEFYEYKDGEKKLIVPEIEWNRMILYDMDSYINILNQLTQNNKVSDYTLFRSLGLNVEEERRRIREQVIQQVILGKEVQIMQQMSISALRSLKPEEEIVEPTEQTPLPGTPGAAEEAGIPGGMGGGMGGLPPLGGPGGGGMGGLPPLGGPGGGMGGELGGLPPLGGPGGVPGPGGMPLGGPAAPGGGPAPAGPPPTAGTP